jgi:hypothetical protein
MGFMKWENWLNNNMESWGIPSPGLGIGNGQFGKREGTFVLMHLGLVL